MLFRSADVLVAHRELIKVLTTLCPTLAFKRQTVTGAFDAIAKHKNFAELGAPEIVEDWVTTMSARLRLVCRHVAHTRARKEKTPQWLRLIDGPGQPGAMEAMTADEGGSAQDADRGHEGGEGSEASVDQPPETAAADGGGGGSGSQEAKRYI